MPLGDGVGFVSVADPNGELGRSSEDGIHRTLSKCLDVTGGATASGTPLQLWDCNGTGAQEWRWRQQIQLVNPRSGRCLNVAADGARLQISDCDDTAGQVGGCPEVGGSRLKVRTSKPIAPRRFVGDVQTALREQIFDVAIAEREAHIKPNGVPDDRGGKLVAGK